MARTIKEIEEIVEDLGFNLIDTWKEGNSSTIVRVKDSYGYKYQCPLQLLMTAGARFVSPSNPFSLHNISLFLKLNNKTFKLSKNNIYRGTKEELYFDCSICKETFHMCWGNVSSSGQNCSICAGRQVGKRNNLKYLRPDLCKEWNYEKNSILPNEIVLLSKTKVWWICKECKETWDMSPKDRSYGQNCSYCSGKRVGKSNSLMSIFPNVSEEWDYKKNYPITPNTITWGSSKSAHWICSKCGHEWKTDSVANRTCAGNGCPKCPASKGEKRISDVLESWGYKEGRDYKSEKTFPDCKNIKELPFDFYIFKYNLCIEYQGEYHYYPIDFFGGEKSFKIRKMLDKIKKDYCRNNGIYFLTISYKEFNMIEKILSRTINDIS